LKRFAATIALLFFIALVCSSCVETLETVENDIRSLFEKTPADTSIIPPAIPLTTSTSFEGTTRTPIIYDEKDEPGPVVTKEPVEGIPGHARTMTVAVNYGNIRIKPSKHAELVDQCLFGTRLGVLEQVGEWYHVILPDGRKGWAHENLFGEGSANAGQRSHPENVPGSPAKTTLNEDAGQLQTIGSAEDKPPQQYQPDESGPKIISAPATDTSREWEPVRPRPRLQEEKKVEPESGQVAATVHEGGKGPAFEPQNQQDQIDKHEGKQSVLVVWDSGPVDVYTQPNVLAPKQGVLPPGTRLKIYKPAGSSIVSNMRA